MQCLEMHFTLLVACIPLLSKFNRVWNMASVLLAGLCISTIPVGDELSPGMDESTTLDSVLGMLEPTEHTH